MNTLPIQIQLHHLTSHSLLYKNSSGLERSFLDSLQLLLSQIFRVPTILSTSTPLIDISIQQDEYFFFPKEH